MTQLQVFLYTIPLNFRVGKITTSSLKNKIMLLFSKDALN